MREEVGEHEKSWGPGRAGRSDANTIFTHTILFKNIENSGHKLS